MVLKYLTYSQLYALSQHLPKYVQTDVYFMEKWENSMVK